MLYFKIFSLLENYKTSSLRCYRKETGFVSAEPSQNIHFFEISCHDFFTKILKFGFLKFRNGCREERDAQEVRGGDRQVGDHPQIFFININMLEVSVIEEKGKRVGFDFNFPQWGTFKNYNWWLQKELNKFTS